MNDRTFGSEGVYPKERPQRTLITQWHCVSEKPLNTELML